ncbi:MAG: cyclic nucleotide-binding domain-containing protein [Gammaproteobacteria bacterium]|nr:cyclic nucleotide-binding domain-containing protein [Gammaproteobacteria bacterium]
MQIVNKSVAAYLAKTEIFGELEVSDLLNIAELFHEESLPANANIIVQNDLASDMHILIDGQAEIVKYEENTTREHHISIIKEGDVLGELALLDDEKRSATARTLVPSKILSASIAQLRSAIDQNVQISSVVYHYLAKTLSSRLRHTNTEAVIALENHLKESQLRVITARYLVETIFVILLYVFSMQIVTALAKVAPNTTYVTVPILVLSGVICFYILKQCELPFNNFGFTVHGAKKVSIQAVIYTLPVLALILLIKLFAIKFIPAFAHEPLFNPSVDIHHPGYENLRQFVVIAIIYMAFIPLQEAICRGALQGALQYFLTGPWKNVVAILLASLVFSLTHIALSNVLAAVTFPLSLFWGWMFLRQKNLVGVSVSHILVGLFSINLMGVHIFFS